MKNFTIEGFVLCLMVCLSVSTSHAIVLPSVRAADKPLTTRLHEADKVFVCEVINRKLLKDDWCHAELKVTRAIKGVNVGELVPVVWRPKISKYDAKEKQVGLAVLKPAHKKRYWLRSDTLVDISFAEQAARSLGKTDGIIREYVDRAMLTKEEEKSVIELAKKRGIEKVAKIKTYYLRPSSLRGISVIGAEQIKGREVSYKMLRVERKDWAHRASTPKEKDIKVGDFWAGKAWDRTTTILMIGQGEYRIGKPHGLTVKQCESMLEKLQNGKYTLGPNAQKERLKGLNWNAPTSFSKFGENINVSFRETNNGDGRYSLRLTVANDKLQINEIMLAMP